MIAGTLATDVDCAVAVVFGSVIADVVNLVAPVVAGAVVCDVAD